MNPNNYNPSERTYTYAEMLANQAAALREAAETICVNCKEKAPIKRGEFIKHSGFSDDGKAIELHCYAWAILALTTDQLALDRHDAKLRKTISNEGSEREPCGHFKANLVGDDYGHFTCDACRHDAELLAELDSLKQQWNALQDYIHKTDFETRPAEIAELKAQTAVMLEKAAEIADRMDVMRQALVRSEIAGEILDLIPTDYAAALAERVREPIEALSILYEETADYIRINNLGDVHHNRSMQYARDVLAAHRAAAGAPEEK